MTLSGWGIFGLAVVLAIIISIIFVRISDKYGGSGKKLGCVLAPSLTLIGFLVLGWITPQVVVIENGYGRLEHKLKYALFSYSGHSLSFGKVYLDNRSDNALILYPVSYGNGVSSGRGCNTPSEIIDSETFAMIPHKPDEYFEVPEFIYVDKDSKDNCRWILESLRDVVQREADELEKIGRHIKSVTP